MTGRAGVKSRRAFVTTLVAGAACSMLPVRRLRARAGPTQIGPDADELISAYMRRFDVPGLSIAFARGKELLFAKGYGWADRDRKVPVDTDSRFRIASNSKALTSAAIFTLIEAGKLRLEDRVFTPDGVLSEFSDIGPRRDRIHAITVHHLLTHTAGGWSNEKDDPMFENRGFDHQRLIAATLRNHPLENVPGEHYAYSNFGYCVLGRVIEKISGEPYARYVKQRILAPVGVHNMQIAVKEPAANEVRYYSHDGGDPYDMPIARMDSHGGWIATPTDMTRWIAGIFSAQDKEGQPPILSGDSVATMTTGTQANPGYACGWAVNKAGNCWHFGSLPGTTSLIVHTSTGLSWAANLNTRGRDDQANPELDKMMWQIILNRPH